MIRGHLTQSGPKSNLGRTVRGHLDVGSLRPPRSPDWPESWTDSVSVHCGSLSVGILLVQGIMGGPAESVPEVLDFREDMRGHGLENN